MVMIKIEIQEVFSNSISEAFISVNKYTYSAIFQ